MATCSGNSVGHCCWLKGKLCPHLEEYTVEGRHWACGLRRKLGSWEDVHTSFEYIRDVQPFFDERNAGESCGSWPRVGQVCGECGKVG